MLDIIYIKNLKIDTIIGVHDWERNKRQIVNINLEISTNICEAAKSDDIKLAIDYSLVAKRLREFLRNSEFFLLETMAERAAEIVLNEFDIKWLRLRIGKPGALDDADDVSVVIEREKKL
ncbi:MAG: dihydroneopterin aldolase [Porticoccus sp.]|jgi:dihydroneopterin aldolase|nr:dihydroneopterin aldolase [Porticoccus sp.]|tara:strand:+ start:420 stop:779 length:360 start_codon:yes stop_codon:yes gene_type:complete